MNQTDFQGDSVRSRESVASWLFGVATRVSAHAKVDAARRQVEGYTGGKSNSRASLIDTILNHKMYQGTAPSLQSVRRALELAQEIAYPYPRGMSEGKIAAALARAGDIEGGLAVARGIDKAQSSPFEIRGDVIPSALIEIALVQAKDGQLKAAKATLLEAREFAQTLSQKDQRSANGLKTNGKERTQQVVIPSWPAADAATQLFSGKPFTETPKSY